MKIIAFDTETHLIKYPDGVNPKGVCMSWYCDGVAGLGTLHEGFALLRKRVEQGYHIVGHNVAFDLHVLMGEMLYGGWGELIWDWLKRGLVHDTMIREKLYLLSTAGSTHAKPCSLAALTERYLDIDIAASKGADAWRMRYGELDGTPIADWPKEAREYAMDDALYTYKVFQAQEAERTARGPASMNSEALQVASAFALRGMTINGLRIDQEQVAKLRSEYEARHESAKEQLKGCGIIKEDGKRNQKVLEAIASEWGVTTTTASGRVSTDRKTLEALDVNDPRYDAYMEYANTIKAVTTFIPQMEFERVHPEFNPVINTMRTSCRSSNYYKYLGAVYGKKVRRYGDAVPSINLQQIPRDEQFRHAFIPESGHVFVCADYSNLELLSAAQTYYTMFGFSDLREVLNSGTNLHDTTGHIIYNDHTGQRIHFEDYKALLSQGDATAKFCRQSAKFVNLGCPGGQSAATICNLANSLGIHITIDQASKWRAAARDRFREFDKFFTGMMPQLQRGYMSMKVDDRWKKVARYDIEVHGIHRAKCTYTAAANGISMQMPSALGKKRAMVRIYEACTNDINSPLFGCKPHLDMHDEFLISVPEAKAVECERALVEHMIDGMQQVMPDMRVGCESMILRRWAKSSESEFGASEFWKEPARDAQDLGLKNDLQEKRDTDAQRYKGRYYCTQLTRLGEEMELYD